MNDIRILDIKFLICISMLLLIGTQSWGQEQISNSSSALEAGGGVSKNGYLLYGGYVRYFNLNSSRKHSFGPGRKIPCPGEKQSVFFLPGRMYAKASLFYNRSTGGDIQYTSVGIDAAAYYTLVNINNVFFINAKGGLTFSSDKAVSKTNDATSDYDTYAFGLLAGVEGEWFFTKSLALVIGGDQRFLLESYNNRGDRRWFAYTGIKYRL